MTLFLSILAALGACIWSWRDPRALYLLLFTALLINAELPMKALGQPVTLQRLVALLAVFTLTLFVAAGRVVLSKPTPSQLAFNAVYTAFGAILLWHSIAGTASARLLLGVLFNLVLFNLVLWILHGLSDRDLDELLGAWLPIVTCLVVGSLLAPHLADLKVLGGHLLEFRQGYRLRHDLDRNLINVWGASLVLIAPIAGYRLWSRGSSTTRGVASAAVALLSIAVVLTFSRAALLGLAIGLATTFAAAARWRPARSRPDRTGISRSVVGVVLLAALVLGGLEWSGVPVARWAIERARPITTGEDRSVDVRLSLLGRAPRAFLDAPLLGSGGRSGESERLPENTLVLVALRFGTVGLALYVGMLGMLIRETKLSWRLAGDRYGGPGWLGLLTAYVFLLVTNDLLLYSPGTLALATTTSVLRRARVSPSREQA